MNELLKLHQRVTELEALGRKYRTLLETSPDIIYTLDPEGHFNFVGGAVEDLIGFTTEELIGKHFSSIICPDDLKNAMWFFHERRTRKRSIESFEVRLITKENKEKYFDIKYLLVELHAFGFYDKPISVKDKKFLGTYGVARDITERKRAEEKTKASLKEKEVMLKEIHHRVKNNMQVISSLLELQSRYIKDKEALEIFKKSTSHVRLMALIHEKLYQSKDLARIDFAEYVRGLTSYLLVMYNMSSSQIKLSIGIKKIFLDINTAIPCALIVNELLSNAVKYAFQDGKKGKIKIVFHHINKNKFELIVSDNGIGFPKDLDFQNTESLGLQLVITLVKQLEGTIELHSNGGTEFKISFTL